MLLECVLAMATSAADICHHLSDLKACGAVKHIDFAISQISHRLLGHNANVGTQPLDLQLPHVNAVHQHLPTLYIVQPLYQGHLSEAHSKQHGRISKRLERGALRMPAPEQLCCRFG